MAARKADVKFQEIKCISYLSIQSLPDKNYENILIATVNDNISIQLVMRFRYLIRKKAIVLKLLEPVPVIWLTVKLHIDPVKVLAEP